jgi:hypothetical protein
LSDNPSSSPAAAGRTALAKRTQQEHWRDPEWQRLWLTIDKLSWQTLSLVPAGEGGPNDFTLGLAVNLSRIGMTHLGRPIQVADATEVALSQMAGFLADIRACTDAGERLIVALPPVTSSPTTPAIAKATDAAILCVLLERMSSAQAKQTLKLVGASRFLGSVIIQPDGSPAA